MTLDTDKIATEMREAAETFQHRPQSMRDRAFVETLNAFQIAANPVNVLAILDDRDALKALCEMRTRDLFEAATSCDALKAELAAAQEAFTAIHMQGHAKGVDVGRAERDALKARVAELEKVLQPFARAGEFCVLEDEHDQDPLSKMDRASRSIEVGDLRRASAVLFRKEATK